MLCKIDCIAKDLKMLCKRGAKMKSSVIRHVLEEELERNIRIAQRYKKELEILPKGSIVKRKIANKEYYYLSYREGKKVITKYIGKIEQVNIEEIKRNLDKRKHIAEVLRNLKQEEKEIRKALR